MMCKSLVARKCGLHLKAESSPRLKPSKKTGTSVTPKWVWKHILSYSSPHTRMQPSQHHDLQSCEIKSEDRSCLKQELLWFSKGYFLFLSFLYSLQFFFNKEKEIQASDHLQNTRAYAYLLVGGLISVYLIFRYAYEHICRYGYECEYGYKHLSLSLSFSPLSLYIKRIKYISQS